MFPQYRLIKGTQSFDGRTPWEMIFPLESDKNVQLWDISVLRSASLNIFSNLGPVRTAILDKALYSVGRAFLPRYLGDDSNYGASATPWLIDNFYPVCNLQGEEFDFVTTFNLMSVHLDVFGECFLYLTFYPDSGFPAIMMLPCWKIAAPRQSGALANDSTLTGKCFGGLFKGLRCEWGVVKNAQGRAVAFHVLGNAESDDALVSTDNMIRVRDLNLGDETRGIPQMAHGIPQGRSIMSMIASEEDFMVSAGRTALIENNEVGGIDQSSPDAMLAIRPAVAMGTGSGPDPVAPGQPSDPAYAEEWAPPGGGVTRYFTAKSGGTVEAFNLGPRPRAEWDSFVSRLTKYILDPIWPFSLIEKEADLGGANCRMLIARANRLCQERQALLTRVARRVIQYACARGFKIGRLPDSGAWYQWGVTYSARITSDVGYDSKAMLLEIDAGVRLASDVVSGHGMGDYDSFLKQRYSDLAKDQLARAAAEKEYGVNLSGVVEPVISGSGTADSTAGD